VQSSATVKVATNDLTVRNIRANATTGILQVTGPAAASTRVVTVPDANFTAARTDAAQSFTGDQTLSTGNLVIGTAGKGIDFSATSHPAGMTSELLSDYEEGVSTVTLAFGGASVGIVYAIQECRYTRIGNRIMIQIGLAISNKGSSTGAATISGLPFTNKNIAYGGSMFTVNAQNMAGVTGAIYPFLAENSSTIALKNLDVAGNANANFTDTAWGAGSYLMISGSYLVA
jgi:hypothetical protein